MARKNIILCGFMGCGKSTIGNLLSRKAGMAFIDLDRYIEKQEGKTVSEIFADSGEAHFRMLERSASKTLGAKNGLVQNDTTRPLLNRPDKDIAMRELYEKRLPLYRAAADIIINADNSPMQICRDILSAL